MISAAIEWKSPGLFYMAQAKAISFGGVLNGIATYETRTHHMKDEHKRLILNTGRKSIMWVHPHVPRELGRRD